MVPKVFYNGPSANFCQALGLTFSRLGNLGSATDSKACCPTFNLCLISCHRNCQFMVNVNNVCPIIVSAASMKKVTKCMGIPFTAMYLHQPFETHVHSNCRTMKWNMVFAFSIYKVCLYSERLEYMQINEQHNTSDTNHINL